jgi:hypothetical protein
MRDGSRVAAMIFAIAPAISFHECDSATSWRRPVAVNV